MPALAFDQPLFLLAFLLLPVYWWAGARSLVRLSPPRWWTAQILRLLLVSCLILALAGIRLVQRSDANCVLFVIDSSFSVPRAERQKALEYVNQSVRNMQENDRVGVLTVGGEARLAFEPSERGKVVAELTVPDAAQTNLARGITTALSYFPEDMARRIVLLSDGNETTGSLLEAARSAATEDTPIDVVSVGSAPQTESLLERMLTPPEVKRGEPFPVKIVASSLNGGSGTIQLLRNGVPVGEKAVTLKPGKNVLEIQQEVETPGFYTYEARLKVATGTDTVEENNKAISFVKVQGKPRVLLVRPAAAPNVVPESFLPKALEAQDIVVDEVAPGALPTQATALLNYDTVVLSDVPARSLSNVQQKVLQAAVRDLGIGMVMIGGENSFGAGGYYQTPIEEALPVDMDVRKLRRFPGVALALGIDYSGSMLSAGINTPSNMSKLDLAKEAAFRAVDTMNPQDQICIMAVDTRANVIVPMQNVTDKRGIKAGINAINGGSGTEMSAGVRAAYEQLTKAEAKVKHAILVTDGATGPFDYGPLIQRMRDEKITFTLVIIDEGQGAEGIEPLRRLSQRTGGRFYMVRDTSEIPSIYTREVQQISKPPIVEEPFLPRVARPGSPLLTGINWDSVPPLLGYDAVFPKSTAEVPLVSHKGDTVLASWQYGLGKSVAFLSDAKARWGAQWVNWNGYAPFWAQLVRYSLKKAEAGSYQSNIEMVNGKAQITVDAVDTETGGFVNFLDSRARVIGPNGDVQTVRLTQTGSGRYVGTFDATRTGSYVATVTQKGSDGKPRAASVGFAVPYSPEYAALQPNMPLLLRAAEITGGKPLTDGSTVFTERRVRQLPVPLAMPLLALALLLFPLDVANRRLMVDTRRASSLLHKAGEAVQDKVNTTARRQRARERVSGTTVAQLRARQTGRDSGPSEESGAETPATTAPPPTPSAPPSGGVVWGNGASQTPRSAPPPRPRNDAPGEPVPSGDDYRSRLAAARNKIKQRGE
ncbi:MAG: VWA domain-containing protein [Armatimonadaceae bacterium]